LHGCRADWRDRSSGARSEYSRSDFGVARISSHFGFIARTARAVGGQTMFHYVLRDRERILDLFELLTGSRFSLNYLRFGGVCTDVTEGFIERVVEACDLIRIRLKDTMISLHSIMPFYEEL